MNVGLSVPACITSFTVSFTRMYIYIYIYICIYTYLSLPQPCGFGTLQFPSNGILTYICICMYICIYTCTSTCIQGLWLVIQHIPFIRTCIHVYILSHFLRLCLSSINTAKFDITHTHMYAYMCVYKYTYTYIHTQSLPPSLSL
jgi:hypothetical protein